MEGALDYNTSDRYYIDVMNILILSWRDPKHPSAGGAEQVVLEHAKGWLAVGNHVTWFSSRFPDSSTEENIDGVKVVRDGYQYLGVQIASYFYYQKNKSNYDLIVDQFHGIPFFTPLYVKKPILAILQELAREVWFLNELPFPLNYLVGVVGYLFEPLVFLFYKKVPFMVGSDSAKKDLVSIGIKPENITVVPHGVIVPKISKLPGKSKFRTISFLGALTKDKGVEDAIRAFALLDKTGEYQFWIIGGGLSDYVDKLKSLVKDLGIQDKTKFWGFVNQKNKFELLSKTHVLVNPSAREGWGLVNIEANAMGTPVAAYKSAGLIDSVKDGQSGIFCNENTPRSLAETVEIILSSEKKYKILCATSIKWSKNFDWKISIKNSVGLINKTFGKDEKHR